uniref:Lipoprotein n=1 Tax=Leptospirillum ferrodiazotrophum TaxID=412449 RepID=C6HVZ5_9BACT|nr:MAG: protein of unknown function [Leptospirillum ferrodiazotrophum]
MNIRKAALVTLSLVPLTLSGCFGVNGTEGAPGLYRMNVKQEFTVGKTTETQVRDELGKPSKIETEKDGGKTLVYDSYKFSGLWVVVGDPARKEKHKVVRFTFDRDKVLRSLRIQRYTQNVIFGKVTKEK